MPSTSNNKTTLLLLSIFLGSLGADRFYAGQTVLGILKLLTFGGCGIWSLVDIILILSDKLTADTPQSGQIGKTMMFVCGGVAVWFIIPLIIYNVSKPSAEEQEKIDKKNAEEQRVRDSISSYEAQQREEKRKAEELAFSKLPKAEQNRILAERAAAAAAYQKSEMETMLQDRLKVRRMKNLAEDAIEDNLKVPDSYENEFVSTPEVRTIGNLNLFVVIVRYTAKNSFGVQIRESKNVIIDATGKRVVEILTTQ